jgi:hypothetical protein
VEKVGSLLLSDGSVTYIRCGSRPLPCVYLAIDTVKVEGALGLDYLRLVGSEIVLA